MAVAALSQGAVQILRQAQHFRKVSGTDFVAGTTLSQGQVQISQQAQHFSKVRYRLAAGQDFRKVRYRFCGRRSTFARSTNFAAGAALSRGTVQSFSEEKDTAIYT